MECKTWKLSNHRAGKPALFLCPFCMGYNLRRVRRFRPFPPWFRFGREIRRENQHWKIKMRFSRNHPPGGLLAATLWRIGVLPLDIQNWKCRFTIASRRARKENGAWSNIFQEAVTSFCVSATCFYKRERKKCAILLIHAKTAAICAKKIFVI